MLKIKELKDPKIIIIIAIVIIIAMLIIMLVIMIKEFQEIIQENFMLNVLKFKTECGCPKLMLRT